ncbi:hypothetical protein ABT282_37915 [Streptomyces sp. NPDC000927]
MFWAGALVFALGIAASLLYGHMDGERLFFCSTIILGFGWVVERTSNG